MAHKSAEPFSHEVRHTPAGDLRVDLYEYRLPDGKVARDVCTWHPDGKGGFIPRVTIVEYINPHKQ